MILIWLSRTCSWSIVQSRGGAEREGKRAPAERKKEKNYPCTLHSLSFARKPPSNSFQHPRRSLMHLRAREFTRPSPRTLSFPLPLFPLLSSYESSSTSQYRMHFRSRLSRFAIPFVSAVFFEPDSRASYPSLLFLLLLLLHLSCPAVTVRLSAPGMFRVVDDVRPECIPVCKSRGETKFARSCGLCISHTHEGYRVCQNIWTTPMFQLHA